MKRILITCGPSYEPIDEARRLTNMSTGRLGVFLANSLAQQGFEVICFRGEGAVYPEPRHAAQVIPFTTNDDLARKLRRMSFGRQPDAVLHAAALCDYRVERVRDWRGREIKSAKISTRDGGMRLDLVPATKVLPLIRAWFPHTKVVGWKYELAGTQADAFAAAWRQIRECRTEACVLNGTAYGEGFAWCQARGEVIPCSTAEELSEAMAKWLKPDQDAVITTTPKRNSLCPA